MQPPARLSAVSGALCGGEPAGPAGASAAAALKGRRSSRLHFARLPSQLLKVARLDPCPPARPQDPPTFLFKTPGPSPPRPSSALPLLRKLGSPIPHGRPCFFTLLFSLFPFPGRSQQPVVARPPRLRELCFDKRRASTSFLRAPSASVQRDTQQLLVETTPSLLQSHR